MPVSPSDFIQLTNTEPGVTRVLEPPKSNSGFLGKLLSIFGTIASIALVPLIGPESLALTIGLETVAIGTDIGFQAASAAVEGRSLSALDIGFSLLGGAGAAFSTIKAAKVLAKTESTIKEVASVAARDGLNSLEKQVLLENFSKVITEKLPAKVLKEKLIRAGLTEDQMLKQLSEVSRIGREHGLNLGRFDDELAFMNQETKIFGQLNDVASKYGFSLNDVFNTLDRSGIDIVGIKTSDQLGNVIKRSSLAGENLRGSELFTKLEGALERDLNPSIFTRVLNAKNAETAAAKVNKALSLSNPNTFITEITNKIFDPIKDKITKKLIVPLKNKTKQKMKHLLRQDLIRKQETKNGVYPAFGSSFINYIRAIPLGNSHYKAGVVFRKWGYKQVIITPTLDLQFIIGWSESSSPGRIYHDFRREYGGPKGQFQSEDVGSSYGANVADIFNLLGFIPDKYISLGVSLISNIAMTKSVITMHTWSDVLLDPMKFIKRPMEDKVLEMAGGQFAKATRDQLAGNRGAMQNYFEGKVKESTESRESEFRKASKGGRGKLDSVRGISGIIK